MGTAVVANGVTFVVAARSGTRYDCTTTMLPVALLYLMLLRQAPAVPAIVSDPDYPLRVQLAQTGSSGAGVNLSAWGHGNILGPPAEGFDYTASCNERFAPQPEGDKYFRARWKKQGLKLEILIQQLGSERISACELKIAVQEEPYDLKPSAPRMTMMPMARPAVPVTDPDANFPLRVQLWVRSSGSSSQMGSHAEGYGNILGATLTGFDFGNTCPIRLSMGRGGDTFQARWAEQGLRMEILVQEVGTRQQNVCSLDVGIKSTPYSTSGPIQRAPPPVVLPGP
jgi:hypothetical protein